MTRSFILSIGISALLLTTITQGAETSNIVVTLDRVASKPVWLLNSKEPHDGLLLELSRLHREGVPDRPILLLVHSKSTLDDIYNALGIMIKAQTARPRIFVFSDDKRSMNEIVLGPSVPFSTNVASVSPK